MRERHWADKAPHTLAACAIFRNEAPFLKEWIEFHAGAGFTHFYLYNNFSTDDFREVLEPFIQRGLVTLVDWPVPAGQVAAYRHCIRRHWRDARWIAFFDLDEFLFSPERIDIRQLLEERGEVPGIHVWQHFFGSSGHSVTPPGPLVDAFTRRAALSTHTTVKTIANPRAVRLVGIHQFGFWWGQSVDVVGKAFTPSTAPIVEVLRINHYWSRSLDDLDRKIRRGDAALRVTRDRDWHFAFERRLDEEDDTSIVPVARAIREGRTTLG